MILPRERNLALIIWKNCLSWLLHLLSRSFSVTSINIQVLSALLMNSSQLNIIETRDRPGHEFALLWAKLCNPQLLPFLHGKIIFVNCKRRAWELDASSEVGAREVFLLNHPHPPQKGFCFPRSFQRHQGNEKTRLWISNDFNPCKLKIIRRWDIAVVKNAQILLRSCYELE